MEIRNENRGSAMAGVFTQGPLLETFGTWWTWWRGRTPCIQLQLQMPLFEQNGFILEFSPRLMSDIRTIQKSWYKFAVCLFGTLVLRMVVQFMENSGRKTDVLLRSLRVWSPFML
jgi:hypothetical protein